MFIVAKEHVTQGTMEGTVIRCFQLWLPNQYLYLDFLMIRHLQHLLISTKHKLQLKLNKNVLSFADIYELKYWIICHFEQMLVLDITPQSAQFILRGTYICVPIFMAIHQTVVETFPSKTSASKKAQESLYHQRH